MFPTKTGDFSWDLAKEIMIWWKSSGNDHGIVIYSNPESAKRCPKVHQDGKKHLSTLLLSINPSHTETKPTEHTLSGFFITIQFFSSHERSKSAIILQVLGTGGTCTCGHVQSRVAQVALQFEIGLGAGLGLGPRGDEPKGIHQVKRWKLSEVFDVITWWIYLSLSINPKELI